MGHKGPHLKLFPTLKLELYLHISSIVQMSTLYKERAVKNLEQSELVIGLCHIPYGSAGRATERVRR